MKQYIPSLARLRYERTHASNRVRRLIDYMLTSEAPHRDPTGLPSWWPFYADCLTREVRETVRAARKVARAEGTPLEEGV